MAPPRVSVQVKELAGGAVPPAHVTKVFKVTQLGKPVTTLRSNAFRISEDGQPVDGKTVELQLLPHDNVLAFHTVLLMDLGPGATKEGRSVLSDSAARFVQEVRKRQSVTVLAFDGSKELRFVGDFPRRPNATKPTFTAHYFPPPKGPQRNLRGAVLDGLKRLDAKLKQYAQPIRVGHLVVFSEGPDVANLVPEATMVDQLQKSPIEVYFVGIQNQSSHEVSGVLARSGTVTSRDLAHLPEAFERMSDLVSANMDGHYVLSYCSQARAGHPKVRLEVDVVSDDLEVATGAIESQFSASGFSSGCGLAKPPWSSLVKATAGN
jgi:hypothetical protein